MNGLVVTPYPHSCLKCFMNGLAVHTVGVVMKKLWCVCSSESVCDTLPLLWWKELFPFLSLNGCSMNAHRNVFTFEFYTCIVGSVQNRTATSVYLHYDNRTRFFFLKGRKEREKKKNLCPFKMKDGFLFSNYKLVTYTALCPWPALLANTGNPLV